MRPFRQTAAKARWVAAVLGALAVLAGCRSKRALLPRGEGAAVVVVSPDGESVIADPGAAFVAEIEPNNSHAVAQTLSFSADAPSHEETRLSVSVAASLATPADVDVFRLVLVQPGGAAAAPAPDGGDEAQGPARLSLSLQIAPTAPLPEALRVEVLQGDASLLRANFQDDALLVPNLPLSSDADLLVRVSRAKAKGEQPLSYSLRAQALSLAAGEEAEPNGTHDRATPISASTATAEMVGYLGWRQDTDWFAVGFPSSLKETVLSLELQVPQAGAAEVGFADAQGVVQHGHGRAAGGVVKLRNVRPPAEGNIVYVRVHNAGPAVTHKRYRLSVMAFPSDLSVEQEPNDTAGQAQLLAGPRFRGHIHPAGDQDVFKVCGAASGSWQIRPPAGFPLEVSLLDAQGQPISQQAFDVPQTLSFSPPSGTDCNFIQIRGKSQKKSNLLDFYEMTKVP